jgi:hypothetical protein
MSDGGKRKRVFRRPTGEWVKGDGGVVRLNAIA